MNRPPFLMSGNIDNTLNPHAGSLPRNVGKRTPLKSPLDKGGTIIASPPGKGVHGPETW